MRLTQVLRWETAELLAERVRAEGLRLRGEHRLRAALVPVGPRLPVVGALAEAVSSQGELGAGEHQLAGVRPPVERLLLAVRQGLVVARRTLAFFPRTSSPPRS